MRLGLERSIEAARALGDPHAKLRAFHVAGSNGKGSTSAMLERIAREAGLSTGLYTSPHLSKLTERVRVNGEPISDATLDAALERVMRDATGELTFFETLTMAAFVALADAELDVVVLEVGLGGRLDATNLIERPLATGITSISVGEGGRYLEHANFLGDTVAAIAREKAGIAKPGVPLVLGPLSAEAWESVLVVAHKVSALVLEPRVAADGALRLSNGETLLLRPLLGGPHQIENAAVAAEMAVAAASLGVRTSHIERGIAMASWPGRLESISFRGRTVVLDAAHNIDGVRALVRALPGLGIDAARTILVFGALADKPFASMLGLLAPFAQRRVYAPPEGRAPALPATLAAIAAGETCETAMQAIERALAISAPGDTLLVTGSIYFVGAVRAWLLGIEADPVIAL